MNAYSRILVVSAVMVSTAACTVQQGEEEGVGSASSAFVTANMVTANMVTANTLTTSSITASSITQNALGGPMLASLQDTTSVGVANRTVFHYIVDCALTPAQSVTYTWSDAQGSHTVTEQGQLGLASHWASGALGRGGQELVSACIAARVNYFGVHVNISARGQALAASTPSDELAAYPYVEGAFWGNLFTSTPYLGSCYTSANVDHSRAAMRDCATGYPDSNGQVQPCGPIALTGPCEAECDRLDSSGQYYPSCGSSGDTENIITVALP